MQELQHPGRQAAQGLTPQQQTQAPQGPGYERNPALARADSAFTAEAEARAAKAQQEAMMLQQAQQQARQGGGLGNPMGSQAQPTQATQGGHEASPQEQAQMIASKLVSGEVTAEELTKAAYDGAIPQDLAAAAMQMADQYAQEQQAPRGLN